MKDLIIFCFISVSFILSFGCKEKKREAERALAAQQMAEIQIPEKGFLFKKLIYSLDNSYMAIYGPVSGEFFYNIDLVLSGNWTSYVQNNLTYFRGIGPYIYFQLYVPKELELNSGTYNFSSEKKTYTFDKAVFSLAYNAEQDTGVVRSLVGGKLTVLPISTNSDYNFEFDVYTAENEHLQGKFSGHVAQYDQRNSNKKSRLKKTIKLIRQKDR